MGYLFAFADGLVSSWAQLMTSCAAGLEHAVLQGESSDGSLNGWSAARPVIS